MIQQELWKSIPAYPGYEVSNLGRVKSLTRKNTIGANIIGKMLSQNKNQDGYLQVKMQVNGVGMQIRVHRLVLLAFVPNPENKPHGNHIDNNRANNIISNLEWVTAKENCDHKCKQNRQNRPTGEKNNFFGKSGDLNWMVQNKGVNNPNYGDKNAAAKLVLDTQTGIFYDCLKDAAIAKGINKITLSTRLLGYRKNKTGIIYA